MSDDGPRTRLHENATGIASMLVTGLWLALLFLPGDWPWLAVMLFGYIVIVPLVAILFGDEEDRQEWADSWIAESSTEDDEEDDTEATSGDEGDSSTRDALETLRERYAAGELTDDQFERKLERLLETETIDDLEDRRVSGREEHDREPEFET